MLTVQLPNMENQHCFSAVTKRTSALTVTEASTQAPHLEFAIACRSPPPRVSPIGPHVLHGHEVRRLKDGTFELFVVELIEHWGDFWRYLRNHVPKNTLADMSIEMKVVKCPITSAKQTLEPLVACSYRLCTSSEQIAETVIHFLLSERKTSMYQSMMVHLKATDKQQTDEAGDMEKMFKTRLCNSWVRAAQTGASFECPRGEECPYAHGYDELRRNPLYKTRICEMFWQMGECKYEMKGDGCHFAHSLRELRHDSEESP